MCEVAEVEKEIISSVHGNPRGFGRGKKSQREKRERERKRERLREPPKLHKPPYQAALLELDPSLVHYLRAKKHSCASETQRSAGVIGNTQRIGKENIKCKEMIAQFYIE